MSDDKATGWIGVLDKLGGVLDKPGWPRRVVTGFVIGVAVIAMTYGWRHQDSIIPQMVGSSVALAIIGGSVGLILLAIGGMWVLDRADRKGDALETYLRAQVAQLSLKLDEADARSDRMSRTMDELIEREDACQRRLGRAEDALRFAGLMPQKPSDWMPK